MKNLSIRILVLLIFPLSMPAEVQNYGPPLDSDIVALYVPPTRAEEPYVATATSLVQYEKGKKSWKQLYSPPWKDATILGLSGYAKSSQMIYVVHSAGIAASRDAGKSWTESVPNGFGSQAGKLQSISVHPENRKEALFAFANACWITRDYGINFEALLSGERFAGAAYVPSESGENPAPLIVSDKKIHIDTSSGFVSIEGPKNNSFSGLVAHPAKHYAYLPCDGNKMLLFNTTSQRGALVELNSTTEVQPIFSSESSLWGATGNALFILNYSSLEKSLQFDLELLSFPVRVASAHPRQPDSLYFAQGGQLQLLSNGFNNLPSQILAPVNQSKFIPLKRSVQNLEKSRMESQSAGNPSLSALIASEPSLTAVVATAVEYHLQNPETLAAWNRKARTRHWIPDLRISGYAREYAYDVTRLDTYSDRYGIERTEDLRLSDEIRTYNSSSVILQWDLQELIYDEEQVDVVRERRYQADYRRELATEITKIYYDRIELMAAYKGISHTSKTKILSKDQLYLAVRKLTDLLNMICGQELFSHIES